ncbi:MAG: T9SS type A sorting domain-containing protein, partial [Algicola sp.]|nr:T9SS type A sorting domain-containing protein [Algicola sp.]
QSKIEYIDMSEFENGLYMVKLITNQQTKTEQILKR